MKTRQNIRKRIKAARAAHQAAIGASRKTHLLLEIKRLLERASPRVRKELRGAS